MPKFTLDDLELEADRVLLHQGTLTIFGDGLTMAAIGQGGRFEMHMDEDLLCGFELQEGQLGFAFDEFDQTSSVSFDVSDVTADLVFEDAD